MSSSAVAVAVITALLLLAPRGWAADSAPSRTLEAIRTAQPPVRDFVAIRTRIEGSSRERPIDPGAFWILDFQRREYRTAGAELRQVSAHAEWYVERGREAGDLGAAIARFESIIYPRVTELTGVGWTPGENGQPRLAIFNGRLSGVSGYMSATDAAPRGVFPFSNERPIIYLNLDAVRPGGASYDGTLAHELEHLAHFTRNHDQEGWLDEGLAELVSNLANDAAPPALSSFRGGPDVQLTAWSELPFQAGAHYEASYLWNRYLMERGGGPGSLPDLLGAGGRGVETVERFAARRGVAGSMLDLFRDWLVANVVGDPTLEDGRYGYVNLDQRTAPTGTLRPGEVVAEDVRQFAADYYAVALDGPGELQVEIRPTVPLVPSSGDQGALFWSLRGDNLDTRLTRQFDLRGLDRATLRYRVWHDLETDYDHCYTLASADALTWRPLAGRHTADREGVGLAFGPGYTGRSDGWLDEEVDLTPFAGGDALVRFECVTDQNYSGPGLALDNVTIPEVGFADDAEADQGWLAEGFVRGGNAMTQPALILAIEQRDAGIAITEIPLDSDGRGRLTLAGPSSGVRKTILAVSGTAPLTLEPMSYRLRLVR